MQNKQHDMTIWGVGGIFWTFDLNVFYELKPHFCALKIQPIWKSVWQFINISCNPEISLLMMDPHAHQNTYAQNDHSNFNHNGKNLERT